MRVIGIFIIVLLLGCKKDYQCECIAVKDYCYGCNTKAMPTVPATEVKTTTYTYRSYSRTDALNKCIEENRIDWHDSKQYIAVSQDCVIY